MAFLKLAMASSTLALATQRNAQAEWAMASFGSSSMAFLYSGDGLVQWPLLQRAQAGVGLGLLRVELDGLLGGRRWPRRNPFSER